MSGVNNLLVDTNVIVYGVEGNRKARKLVEGKTIFISVISEIELLSKQFKSTDEEDLMKDFVSNCFHYCCYKYRGATTTGYSR
jgi:predicted nucleic acid-binding protein